MKKILIFVLYLILLFPFIVKADLTGEQEDAIASFAENLIIKQSQSPHTDGSGFPLIAYNMGSSDRIEGYNENLIMFGKDERGINTINNMKWPFDCASWASYVYKHVLGVKTTMGDGGRPFTVSHFLNNALNEVDFYVIRRNTSVYDLGPATKGDLLIIEGSHIMVYLGDGRISHVSTSAIQRGGSLGAEVVELSNRFPGEEVTVIRLKGTNAKPNTTITWPDTHQTEDLGQKDDGPSIHIDFNNTGHVKEGEAIISFSDDKMISKYSISLNKDEYKWQNVNQKNYKIKFIAKSNGTYYVYAMDNKNQIAKQVFVVSNIDKKAPVITSINYQYNGDETYNVTVSATDDNKITYTLDGSLKTSNIFTNLSLTKHNLVISDEAGNTLNYTIDLTATNIPLFDVSFEKDYQKKKTLMIKPQNEDIVSYYTIKKTSDEPTGWTKYQKDIKIDVSENGTYYLWLKSKNNIVYYKKIDVNNVDTTPPVIDNYTIDNISSDNFTVTINANDSCELEYSIVNGPYQKSNIFTNLKKNNYLFLVRDCAYNVSIVNISSNEFIDKYQKEDIKTDENDKENNDSSSSLGDLILLLLIIGVSIAVIINIINIIKISNKKKR